MLVLVPSRHAIGIDSGFHARNRNEALPQKRYLALLVILAQRDHQLDEQSMSYEIMALEKPVVRVEIRMEMRWNADFVGLLRYV